MRRRTVARGIVLAGAAIVACAHGAVEALADCGATSLGVISGDWQLRVTYDGTTGSGAPVFDRQRVVGSSQVVTATFAATCSAPGACSDQIDLGPDYATLENASGLLVPNPTTPLVQSASAYSSTFGDGGYGGPGLPPCSRPRPWLYVLDLSVAQAIPAPGPTGWSATVLTGTETKPASWTCNGSTGVLSATEHFSILAVPVGSAFPTSSVLPCAQTPAPVAAAPAAATSGASAGGSSSTSGASAPVISPSTISATLATPRQAFGSLSHAAIDLAITVGLMLFITFPAQLFNKTLEENYDDIRDIAVRRFRAIAEMRRRLARESSPRTRVLAFSAVVLVGGLLGGLNDPNFGFNRSSAITYIGVVFSMLFGVLVSSSIARAYRESRNKTERGRLHALPAGLLVGAACVLVSRITQFRPGYLYGVIAGVAFTKELTHDEEGQSIIAGTATTFSLALVAWLAWVPVSGGSDPSVGVVLLTNFLAALVVGGLVGCTLGLVPLKFMPGGKLLGWNRWVWGSAFGIALFTLVQALLHPNSSPAQPGNAPIITAVVLLVVFGVVSVAFNRYFEARKKRREHERKRAEAEQPVESGALEAPTAAAVTAAAPVELD